MTPFEEDVYFNRQYHASGSLPPKGENWIYVYSAKSYGYRREPESANAYYYFGAWLYSRRGHTGSSYAITTGTHRKKRNLITFEDIAKQIAHFEKYTHKKPHFKFWIYGENFRFIGKETIPPLFRRCINCSFPLWMKEYMYGEKERDKVVEL